MSCNSSIFKAYDIRGTINIDFIPIDFTYLGQALGILLNQQNITSILIGYDNRSSSTLLQSHLIHGLQSQNIHVIHINHIITTPLCVWYMLEQSIPACAMITASHNSWQDNGLKLYLSNNNYPIPFTYAQLQQLEIIYQQCKSSTLTSSNNQLHSISLSTHTSNIDIILKYTQTLATFTTPYTSSKQIFWNSMQGSSKYILKQLQSYNIISQHTSLQQYIQTLSLTGPDPSLLIQHTLPKHQHIFSFDGDGDRLHVISNNHIITAEEIAINLALMLIKQQITTSRQFTIVHDVHLSSAARKLFQTHNITLIESKVGHTFIQTKLLETGADMGFEASGHFFFKTWKYIDDGIYTAFLLSNCLENFIRITGFISNIQRIFCTTPHDIIDQLINHAINNNLNINTLDGVKFILSQGWILIRASNTQQCLSIMYEGNNESDYQYIQKYTQELLKSFID